jgi:type IV pilus assembly protein PilO
MQRDFTFRRQAILAGVVILVILDVGLAAYSWQLSSAPRAPQQRFAAEQLRHNLLKGEIDRAQKIKDSIPSIQKDCDKFEQSLFPASSGYSSVTSELGSIARKSGVRVEDRTFKETKITGRGTTEVAIDATISGDYKSVIQFLNGVQRSVNHYEVDSLSLASENAAQGPTGVLKVALHLKTYFRAAS